MMVEAGNYVAKPQCWGFTETKDGKEQFAIQLVILGPTHEGQEITWFGGFSSDKATEFTLKTIRAAGWVGDDINSIASMSPEVRIVVETEEYMGKWRTKVRFINPMSVSLAERMIDPNRARSFGSALNSRLRSLGLASDQQPQRAAAPARAAVARPAVAQTNGAPTAADDLNLDDIGF